MPFCRTCGITESWAAPAWLNYNNASDVKPRNVPRAVSCERASPDQLQSNLWKSHMFHSTLLSPSDDTLCAVALSAHRSNTSKHTLICSPKRLALQSDDRRGAMPVCFSCTFCLAVALPLPRQENTTSPTWKSSRARSAPCARNLASTACDKARSYLNDVTNSVQRTSDAF